MREAVLGAQMRFQRVAFILSTTVSPWWSPRGGAEVAASGAGFCRHHGRAVGCSVCDALRHFPVATRA